MPLFESNPLSCRSTDSPDLEQNPISDLSENFPLNVRWL